MSTDFEIKREYQIQNPTNQSYRLTLPKAFFKEYSIKENTEFDIEISSKDGFAVIDYIISSDRNNISRKMTKSNHTIRIPSSIGDCLLSSQNKDINWSAYVDEDIVKFRAKTAYEIPIFDTSDWDLLKNMELKSIKQSRKLNSGDIKEQEHFDMYFNESETKCIGWDSDTTVVMKLVFIDNRLSLQIQPKSENSKSLGKKVNTSGFKQNDARIYIPRALVRSLNLANKEFDIFYKDKSIILR